MTIDRNPLVEQEEDAISLLDLLQVIVDNFRLLVLGPLAVGMLVLGISFLIPPTYTAKTQFLPPQQQQSAAASMLASLGGLGGLAGAAAGLKNPADQFLAYMKSVSLQDAIIDRLNLQERYKTKTKMDARNALSSNVRTASGKDGLISVDADDKDPQFAADLANAHVEELSKLLGKLAVTEAQQRRLFFERQLTQAKEKLIQSEIDLKATGVSGSVLKAKPNPKKPCCRLSPFWRLALHSCSLSLFVMRCVALVATLKPPPSLSSSKLRGVKPLANRSRQLFGRSLSRRPYFQS